MIDQIENTEVVKDLMKNRIIFGIITIVIVFIGTKLILNIIRKLINKLLEGRALQKSSINTNKLQTISKTLYSVIRVLIIFVATIIILDLFGINTSTMIATAGVGGVAIALGTQTIIEDFIKGILIILDDRIRVGEWIKVAGVEGEVEALDFRVTKIRDFNGSLHIIPNSQITNVQNFNRGIMLAEANFNVSYDTKLAEVKEMVNFIAEELSSKEEYKKVFKEKFRVYEIKEFQEFSYKVRLIARVRNGLQWQISREAREMIKVEMEKRKIKSHLLENVDYEEIQSR